MCSSSQHACRHAKFLLVVVCLGRWSCADAEAVIHYVVPSNMSNVTVIPIADGDNLAFMAALRKPCNCNCDVLRLDLSSVQNINLTDINVDSLPAPSSEPAPRVVHLLGSPDGTTLDYGWRSECTVCSAREAHMSMCL